MRDGDLADRLRAIVGSGRARTEVRLEPDATRIAADATRVARALEDVLNGAWEDDCFVVEHRVAPDSRCGRVLVGDLAARFRDAASDAAIVAGGPARAPFVFFDLETTGLNGGAGTHAWLVGCGRFDEDEAFVTRQYVLTRLADERPLLAAVARELSGAGALVSFNGKSFDAPLLEMRYAFHRLAWPGERLPHIDVLHPARRFWRSRDVSQPCSLGVLESDVLGAHRDGDVPGYEIPSRYFAFVRTGDARSLGGVLRHNRLDLLSLAGLSARLFGLVREGPDSARDAGELLALGRLYARAGLEAQSRAALVRAVASSDAGAHAGIRVDALRLLALAWRRVRQFDQAATCWKQLLDQPGCPRHVAREATEALAIHHEHRVRDLDAARGFALRTLEHEECRTERGAGLHRLARIERKLGAAARDARFW